MPLGVLASTLQAESSILWRPTILSLTRGRRKHRCPRRDLVWLSESLMGSCIPLGVERTLVSFVSDRAMSPSRTGGLVRRRYRREGFCTPLELPTGSCTSQVVLARTKAEPHLTI